jgi:hypothetical protein
MKWFSDDVVKAFRRRRAFDKEGIFIGDASYLFVPDNPNYEGSVKLLFDEHNHPISEKAYKGMSDDNKARCQWRRCYKMVTLLHTNRARDFFLFVGTKVVSGKDHECPIFYSLVDQFVDVVGKGVIKELILDRGFLDGAAISTCKRDYGIDILIPVRSNMDISKDAMALFKQPEVDWKLSEEPEVKKKKPPRPQPKAVRKRERKRQETLLKRRKEKPPPPPEKTIVKIETAVIGDFRSWSSCTVPLSVVATRERYADGHERTWLLLYTADVEDPCEVRKEYHIRTAIEERYRQLKCFVDLADFTSRAFSMVVNQVVFTLLAYNLLQFFLLREGKKKLNKKPMPSIRKQLVPSDNYTIVYWQGYYGRFSTYELLDFILNLEEKARKKIASKCRRRRLESREDLTNPRPP